jgi:hypothetical protein
MNSQPPVNAPAGPSGLTQEQKSSENAPAPISAVDVPLPSSPFPKGMDVDNNSGNSKGNEAVPKPLEGMLA